MFLADFVMLLSTGLHRVSSCSNTQLKLSSKYLAYKVAQDTLSFTVHYDVDGPLGSMNIIFVASVNSSARNTHPTHHLQP
jgi:hypothetical protein